MQRWSLVQSMDEVAEVQVFSGGACNIRDVDAIIHVVRCFEDPNVVHVSGSVDPARDVEVIETELLLKDLETVENRLFALKDAARKHRKGTRNAA